MLVSGVHMGMRPDFEKCVNRSWSRAKGGPASPLPPCKACVSRHWHQTSGGTVGLRKRLPDAKRSDRYVSNALVMLFWLFVINFVINNVSNGITRNDNGRSDGDDQQRKAGKWRARLKAKAAVAARASNSFSRADPDVLLRRPTSPTVSTMMSGKSGSKPHPRFSPRRDDELRGAKRSHSRLAQG